MGYDSLYKEVLLKIGVTKDELAKWYELSEETKNYKPKNGGWGIGDNLEHIMLTNHYLLKLIDKGKNKALRKAKVETNNLLIKEYSDTRLSKLLEVGLHGSFKWERPEHMEPVGDISIEDIRKKIDTQLLECKGIMEEISKGEGTLQLTTMSVNGLGKLDVYEYIYFLLLHIQRHITQMEKVLSEYEVEVS